ncbi:hypothetical protein GCM10022380_64650 [Amycolatopsis tucumanensis]|uniref:Uncharacterized protein n=1 Tax=Amycolatopsis tucumanensis TaxID=401106 RepID=A0ABP7J8C5_9PSEU
MTTSPFASWSGNGWSTTSAGGGCDASGTTGAGDQLGSTAATGEGGGVPAEQAVRRTAATAATVVTRTARIMHRT